MSTLAPGSLVVQLHEPLEDQSNSVLGVTRTLGARVRACAERKLPSLRRIHADSQIATYPRVRDSALAVNAGTNACTESNPCSDWKPPSRAYASIKADTDNARRPL